MRTILLLASVSVFLFFVGATAQEPPVNAAPQPPFNPVASVSQLMKVMIDPSANFIWNAVKTEVSSKGIEEIAPKNDEEWAAVSNNALMLTEAGNLLMMRSLTKDTEGWNKMSRGLVDAGVATLKAAEAKDAAAIFEVGETIRDACAACHIKYARRRR